MAIHTLNSVHSAQELTALFQDKAEVSITWLGKTVIQKKETTIDTKNLLETVERLNSALESDPASTRELANRLSNLTHSVNQAREEAPLIKRIVAFVRNLFKDDMQPLSQALQIVSNIAQEATKETDASSTTSESADEETQARSTTPRSTTEEIQARSTTPQSAAEEAHAGAGAPQSATKERRVISATPQKPNTVGLSRTRSASNVSADHRDLSSMISPIGNASTAQKIGIASHGRARSASQMPLTLRNPLAPTNRPNTFNTRLTGRVSHGRPRGKAFLQVSNTATAPTSKKTAEQGKLGMNIFGTRRRKKRPSSGQAI